MSVTQAVVLAGLALFGVALAVVAERFGRRLVGRAKPLNAHYARLGRVAPRETCPCRAGRRLARTYGECCRGGDVARLEVEVRQFIWEDWMRRSGGRSRARSMRARLSDFPLTETSLPEWVTRPEKHAFPIAEEMLRAWTPLTAAEDAGQRAGAEPGSDLPL